MDEVGAIMEFIRDECKWVSDPQIGPPIPLIKYGDPGLLPIALMLFVEDGWLRFYGVKDVRREELLFEVCLSDPGCFDRLREVLGG